MEKKSTNIKIQIKYGKNLVDAEFGMFYSNGLLIPVSMYIDNKKQMEHTTKNYWRTNYKKIYKQFHIQHGEIA